MYCRKCGSEVRENQKFCSKCGSEILDVLKNTCESSETVREENENDCGVCRDEFAHDESKNSNSNDAAVNYEEIKKEIKVEAGATAFNGERQLISIFNFDNTGVQSRHYMRTTQSKPKFTYSFKKSSVSMLERKKTPIFSIVDKLRLVVSAIFILLGFLWFIATWPFLLIGVVFGGTTYLTRRWPTLIIQLKTGEKIKVYYENDEDIAELSRMLVD